MKKINFFDTWFFVVFFVLMLALIFGAIYAAFIYNNNKFTIYQDVRIVSYVENTYRLSSGIMYNGNIEYSIYPYFQGAKTDCEQMKYINGMFLKAKMNEFQIIMKKTAKENK